MEVSPELKEVWNQLCTAVMSGSADTVSRLHCPGCGAALHITFTPGQRTALSIRCVEGCAATCLDGEFAAPPWVATLGERITTS